MLLLSSPLSSPPSPSPSHEDFIKISIHQKWKQLGINLVSAFTDTKCVALDSGVAGWQSLKGQSVNCNL
ncbi:hypothetical protein BT93_L4820 [Corymbia citriodora subsp. variegata]|uniref:Uncharacterized protein n=1 Tax=Corymbia citriodora subsp. variegata TaxID=360336 RepID=A0A8T0CTK7_CORYI|nr:hypothetical protein BT93_L4820 [Corymbia citriodora subsp. variegata]